MNNDIKNKRPERKKYEIKRLQIKRSNKTKENKKQRLTFQSILEVRIRVDVS